MTNFLSLTIMSLKFHEPEWWRAGGGGFLLDTLEQSELIERSAITYSFKEGTEWTAYSPERFAREVSTRRDGRLFIRDYNSKDFSLELSLRNGFSDISARLTGARVQDSFGRSMDKLLAWSASLVSSAPVKGLGWYACVGAPGEYARPRPPPFCRWPRGVLALAVDPAWHKLQGEPELREDVELFQTATLSEGAVRYQIERLLVIRWADRLENIGEAKSQSHVWLGRVASRGRIDGGYNSHGDRLYPDLLAGLLSRGVFQYYDPERAIGYLAVERGQASLIEDVANWMRKHALPDGTPIAAICIIAPSREDAIALRDEARAGGAKALFYRDPDFPKRLWNPFPPGLWLH